MSYFFFLAFTPSLRVSFASQPGKTTLGEGEGDGSVVPPSVSLHPEFIVSEVLEKVCNQLFVECADRVLSEDIPGSMQEPTSEEGMGCTPIFPTAKAGGDQSKESVPKSTFSTPLSISSD